MVEQDVLLNMRVETQIEESVGIVGDARPIVSRKTIVISIIVATFKAEEYLKRFLESTCRQVAGFDGRAELIFVDDCSPDNSAGLIKEYEQKYDFIRIVRHRVNMGAAAARNTGIDNARGMYLLFVDPDDLLTDNALSELLRIIQTHRPDIIRFQYRIVLPDGQCGGESKSRAKGRFVLADGRSSFRRAFEDVALGMNTPDGCYRRSVASDLRQDGRFRIAEDRHFGWEFFRRSSVVYCCPSVLYEYYQNSASITHNVTREGIEGALLLNEIFWKEARSHSWYAEIYDLMFTRLVVGIVGWQYHEVFNVRSGDVSLKASYFRSLSAFVSDFACAKVQPLSFWLLWISARLQCAWPICIYRLLYNISQCLRVRVAYCVRLVCRCWRRG